MDEKQIYNNELNTQQFNSSSQNIILILIYKQKLYN